MTLPEWVESVAGLVGKLSALPVQISRRAVDAAVFVGVSFSSAVVTLHDEGLAKPLRELANSKLQKIRSTDVADAAMAHNAATLKRAEASRVEAEAESIRAEAMVKHAVAEKERATARAIDAETEMKQLRLVQDAEAHRSDAELRLRLALEKLKIQGGDLYIDPPEGSNNGDKNI